MAAIQKASQAYDVFSVSGYTAESTVSEGAVVKFGTEALTFAAVGGAADENAFGVAKAAYTSGDTGCSVQHYGIANVLLAATETVTMGQYVVTAAAAGTVRALAGGDGALAVIVGRAMCDRTAGAAAEMIPVLLLWGINPS